MQPDPYANETKKSTLALGIGIGILVTLLLVGGGLAALGLLGPKNESVTVKAPAGTAPVLPKVVENEPVLPKPAEAVRMPDDVYEWLEHLRKTEAARKEMSADQIGDLTVMMAKMKGQGITDAMKSLFTPEESPIPIDDGPSQSEDLAIDAAKKRAQWKELSDFFLSYPPPAECAPIQASYAQALGETGAMIVEVLEAVDMASESPEKAIAALTKMQGTSGGRIDELAKQTDSQVSEICRRYETRKWFDIQGDVGGGFLSGLGGF